MKQPGSFLKGSGPDDTQRARTAPAAPGAREMRAVRLGFYFCLIKSFLSVAPKEKRPRRSPRAKKLNDVDALFRRLKRDVKTDYNSKRPSQLAQRGARATVGLHEGRDLIR